MKRIDSISAAALLLGSSIFLSRVLGYFREMLLAYQFGAGWETDSFYAAFQIPDLLNYFLAGGALSIAFIPLYNRVKAKDGQAAAEKLMATVLGTLGLLAVLATALLWVYAEPLIHFQFPKFDEETTQQTIFLTRIVLPAQIFFITGGILQAVLMAERSFHAAALAPLIYNLFIIMGGFFLHDTAGIAGFAIGTTVGAFLGPFPMPLLWLRRHVPIRLRIAPFEKMFLVYLALAAPLMFGQTLLTLDEWYGRWFGALLPAGTVAYLGYARRLLQAPVAVIGQALAAAALPTLSRLYAEGKTDEMTATLQAALQTALSLAVFAGAAFFALAGPLVILIYQHGAFGLQDTVAVAILTGLFAFAMPGWIVQQVILRGFYARGDTWRPMLLGTAISLGVIPLYLFLSDRAGVNGLAVAGVLSLTLNALTTLLLARWLHKGPSLLDLCESLFRSLFAAVPAAYAALHVVVNRRDVLPLEDWSPKALAAFDLVAGGVVFGLIALPCIFVFGDSNLKSFLHSLIRRITGRRQHEQA